MGDSIDPLARSFERHLRAENKAERTIHTYLEALGQLAAHLQAAERDGLASARTEDIEEFLGALLVRCKPGTAANRYRSLRVFYRWLEDEGEIPASPMARLKPPAVPEQPVPVLDEAALHRLLDVCAGRDFEARRDTALILVLLDAGPRRAVRPQGRPSARPVSTGTCPPSSGSLRGPLDRPQGSDHRLRHRTARSPSRPPGRHRGPASTSVPPYLRPPLACRRRRGNRPDAPRRLAFRSYAAPLRCLRSRR